MDKDINKGELSLVAKMIEGDMDSFKYFFDKYYDDLCNFVHIYLHDQALSEEVVQDIFVYFWENKGKLQINTSVKAYLFSASKFKSLNLIRDTKTRHKIIEKRWKAELKSHSDFDDSYLDTDELKRILNSAVDQLPPKCKEIFLLSKHEELSNHEIAKRLGVSVKTVENQMTIALKKLRDYLLLFRGKIFFLLLFQFLS